MCEMKDVTQSVTSDATIDRGLLPPSASDRAAFWTANANPEERDSPPQ
jgi:hypothetical protein